MKEYKPSTYNDSMPAEVITRFSKGESREEFCAAHNLAEETFSAWVKKIPEFREAYNVAQTKAKAWYMKLGRQHLEEGNGKEDLKLNMPMYNRTMNTRFHMPEQRKLKIKGLAKKKLVQDKMKAILKAVEDGELTALEATQMTRVVEGVAKIHEHGELEERIAQIEQAQKIGVGDEDFEEVKD